MKMADFALQEPPQTKLISRKIWALENREISTQWIIFSICRSQKGHQLTHAYFRVAKLMSEKSDAEENLDDVLISLNHVSSLIGDADPRRALINTILNKVPLEHMEKIKRRRCEVEFSTEPPGEKTLIKLHRQVIR